MRLSRRHLLQFAALGTLLAARPGHAGYNIWNNEFTFTRDEIQAAVASRFPVTARYAQVMAIRLANPIVSLDPANGRLRTRLEARVENPLLFTSPIDGRLAVTNGLRYDAARRAVLLDRPAAEAVEVPGLPAQYAQQLNSAATLLASEVLRDYPVHTFGPNDLAIGGRRVEPSEIIVEAEGLKVPLVFR
jgi:hypothetical protein